MRLKLNKIKKWAVAAFVAILGLLPISGIALAEGYSITMSPMNQRIILTPGEKYTGSFNISNSVNNSGDLKYKIVIQPFYVDENYNVYYGEEDELNRIIEWTTVDNDSGTLAVGAVETIHFTIDVPIDAPAGGQYEAITAVSVNDGEANESTDGVGTTIKQSIGISHIIYAEIAGTTRRSGEVIFAEVPSFIFDGDISAESTIKNTGNTHGVATYTLQIFPLFSSEEVYTNEENPEDKTILPNRTLINRTIWNETPVMGIFNVKYTVEFEGVTTEVTKLVIKCPLWLLFIIIFIIVALITWIVIRIKKNKRSAKAED